MPVLHAIVLGLVQGITEFLPISSSGHLQLVPWLLGWDDFAGRQGVEQAFDASLHLGTLAGVVAYLWSDVSGLARGGIQSLTRRGPVTREGRTAWLLVASAVPAAALGAALDDTFARMGEAEWGIGLGLVVFGLVLAWADRLVGNRAVENFELRDAMFMGAAQAIALSPGVSRSGITMTAARRLGYTRDAAARLSFLMGLPVIAGALVWSGLGILNGGLPAGMGLPLAIGVATSGVSGWIAVWAILRIIRTRTFTPFVIYRVIAGVGVMALAAGGFRAG